MPRIFATAAFIALTVTAADAGEVASVSVTFGDLNLSRPADAKILATRLQAAAKSVCRTAGSGQPPLIAMREMDSCTDTAISTALARIASVQTNAVRANLVNDREALASN